MNKQDRKELEGAVQLLGQAATIIQAVAEAEQEKYDNLNEGLQATERGEKFETNSAQLEECTGEIETTVSVLDDVMQA